MGMWLGQIFWWNVAAEGRPSRVTLPQLIGWVHELGLDMPSMPKPKGAHAFRAASGKLTRKYVDGDGLKATLSTIEVSANTEFIVRHVVKTTTDPRSQKLLTEKVAQLKFFRPTRTAAGRRPGSEVSKPSLKPGLVGADADAVLALVEDFRSAYAERNEYLSMAALRRVVRDFVVQRCDGVCVRASGGLYFVENRWEPQLQRLTQLIDRFGPEASCHLMPLVDSPAQKVLVSRGVADTLVADARQVVELLAGPQVSAQQGYAARKHLLRCLRLYKHFGDLLAFEVGTIERVDGALQEASALVMGAWEESGMGRRGPAERFVPPEIVSVV